MRQVLKWVAIVLAGVATLAVVATGVVYVVAARRLGKRYEVPVRAVAVPTDSAAVATGGRLVVTRGCTGCHGPDLGRQQMFAAFDGTRLVAPNLTRVARDYSDAELVRA